MDNFRRRLLTSEKSIVTISLESRTVPALYTSCEGFLVEAPDLSKLTFQSDSDWITNITLNQNTGKVNLQFGVNRSTTARVSNITILYDGQIAKTFTLKQSSGGVYFYYDFLMLDSQNGSNNTVSLYITAPEYPESESIENFNQSAITSMQIIQVPSWISYSYSDSTGVFQFTTLSDNIGYDYKVGVFTVKINNTNTNKSLYILQKPSQYYSIDGYEYVELDNGLKIATRNVGANNEYRIGSKFSWGEVETKTSYTTSNYKWRGTSDSVFTKYNENDNLTELQPEDDAATVNMGGGWRTPKHDDIEDLKGGFAKNNGYYGVCLYYGYNPQNSTKFCFVYKTIPSFGVVSAPDQYMIAELPTNISDIYKYKSVSVMDIQAQHYHNTNGSDRINGITYNCNKLSESIAFNIGLMTPGSSGNVRYQGFYVRAVHD